MVAAIAVTEPDAGSDVAGIRTRAVRDGDEWVINGTKLYITNGTQADWLCLLARTSDEGGYRGMSQIVVPTDSPGLLGQPQARQAGQPVERHRRAVVRRPAGAGGQHHRRDRPRLPAADGPVPERAHDRRLHVDRRHAGRGRADHRVRQAAPGVRPARWPTTSTSSSRWPSWSPRSTWPGPTTTPAPRPTWRGEDTTRYATIAKLMTGRLDRKVADTCLQFHGGIGYMEETWTARYFRDSRLLSIGGGRRRGHAAGAGPARGHRRLLTPARAPGTRHAGQACLTEPSGAGRWPPRPASAQHSASRRVRPRL